MRSHSADCFNNADKGRVASAQNPGYKFGEEPVKFHRMGKCIPRTNL